LFAIAYVLGMVALGDRVTRHFFPTWSLAHRAAGAFLVGLLLSTWITYLGAAVFAGLERPLLVGNVLFAGVVVFVLRDLPRRLVAGVHGGGLDRLRAALGRQWPELAVLGLLILLAAWLATSTFAVNDTELLMGNLVYSDFGPTTAIAQSFAVGNNFPTVYPHFAGEPIRYHFLFYFQAGNLTFLGFDPAFSLNLLSVLSLGALLALVMTLGRLVFRSAAAGWLGAALFFFHGSLAWLPYLASLPSLTGALDAIAERREFLASGFPYRGEDWGVWSMAIFANQRHFASGIGILLLVLVFLVGRWRVQDAAHHWLSGLRGLRSSAAAGWRSMASQLIDLRGRTVGRFVFAGLLLGALPMWNGAVFVAAAVLLAALFVLMPDRRYLLFLAAAAGVAALPQLEFLRPSAGVNAPYPALSWGYVIDDPTPINVAVYFAFSFGPKLLLAVAALSILRVLPQKLFVAAAALVALTLTVQFSAEALVNHKFLNIWLVLLNLFAAYALLALWRARPVANLMFGRLLAAVLVIVIAVGGVIDLVPFRNGHMLGVPFRDDPLADWVADNTASRDVFLTDILVTHPILARGRSIFLGWTYYAWSAGYDMGQREEAYRHLYTEPDPQQLAHMLRANHIAYVVFDDDVRTRGFVENPNEQVYRDNFAVAFESSDYGNIRIYAVP
jgi:hypothetical protein